MNTKNILFAFLLSVCFLQIKAQDLIVRKDSVLIFCKILDEDSTSIYYRASIDKKYTRQSIQKTSFINYYYKSNLTAKEQKEIQKVYHEPVSKYLDYNFKKRDTLWLNKSNEVEFKGGLLYDWELKQLMSKDTLALAEMKKASSVRQNAAGFASLGTLLAVTPLKFARGPLFFGAVLFAVATSAITCIIAGPMYAKAKRHYQKGIQLFNEKHR